MYCAVDNCEDRAYGKGFCRLHYQRWRKHGDPLKTLVNRGTGMNKANGYHLTYVKGHPLAQASGYAYTHRLVVYDALGPGPHPCNWCGEVLEWGDSLFVDHLNGNKMDNRLENLVPSCQICNQIRQRSPEVIAKMLKYVEEMSHGEVRS